MLWRVNPAKNGRWVSICCSGQRNNCLSLMLPYYSWLKFFHLCVLLLFINSTDCSIQLITFPVTLICYVSCLSKNIEILELIYLRSCLIFRYELSNITCNWFVIMFSKVYLGLAFHYEDTFIFDFKGIAQKYLIEKIVMRILLKFSSDLI